MYNVLAKSREQITKSTFMFYFFGSIKGREAKKRGFQSLSFS